jgi:hypothetical protein
VKIDSTNKVTLRPDSMTVSEMGQVMIACSHIARAVTDNGYGSPKQRDKATARLTKTLFQEMMAFRMATGFWPVLSPDESWSR